MNELIPNNESIFVRQVAKDSKTECGFIVPEAIEEAQSIIEGEIVIFNSYDSIEFEDSYGKLHQLHNGTRILYRKLQGTMFPYQGKEYICLSKNQIIAIIDNDNTSK